MNNRDRALKKLSAETQQARRRQYKEECKAKAATHILAVPKVLKEANQKIVKVYDNVLLGMMVTRAPKLLDAPYAGAIRKIPLTGWVRSIETWVPKGKSRDTQFISLVDHLLSKYKTPQFLWSAFFDNDPDKTIPIAVHVAGGGSLYEKIQDKSFPVPFTRKLCHEFLKTPSDYTFMSAVRKIQVEAAGGDRRLFQIWNKHLSRFKSAEDEVFWGTVLHFFAKTTMLDPAQIMPTVDYIANRYRQDRTFSMKGRSMIALMRDRDEWHTQLSKVKVLKQQNYEPSGFKAASYTKYYRDPQKGGEYAVNWRIFEILKATHLADEGRAMHHCVYSYAPRIQEGKVSIWSLCGESKGQDLRYLTIEVNNLTKQIVQLRGVCNSLGKPPEHQIVALWAQANGLTVTSSGRW